MAEQGGCRCGAVMFEVDAAPAYSAMCWCDACRRSAGAPGVVWALFPRDRVRITGTPASYDSSPGTTRQFCATCGTGLFYLNEDVFPGQIDIQAAAFADRDAFPPSVHIQVADAPAWMAAVGDLPRFDRYPAGAS